MECVSWVRGGVGCESGKWIRGLGLGFVNPVETGGLVYVCMCLGCGGVGGVGSGRVGSCYVVLVVSLDY